jgi:predicted ATPase/class 3 adenylate cyclase/GAF domain-containing protein
VPTNQDIGITEVIPGYVVLEAIRESCPHIIYRAIRDEDGAEVAIKTLADKYPQKEDVASLRREYKITRQLQGEAVIHVYALVPYGQGNLAMVMEHFGVSLSQFLSGYEDRQLPLEEFFPLAMRLSRAVGSVHEQKIVHKNLGPSNILIAPETGELRVIDFGASSELSREHLGTVSLTGRIYGALPFTSPELTGRINRDIDYRADYYSMGVLFYLMLTGQLPFNAGDPLEWVHCIISREAPPADTVNGKVPKVLAGIVAKLMAKNAEDRYQSSPGLEADLERCREEMKKGTSDFAFPLAQSDIYRQFQIPQKLYGRDQELEKLESCFENVSRGAVEFCLVTGYSGVGKTVFVQELGGSIVKKRGYLILGKFEQFKQNAAYAALSAAFRDLMRQLLGEPADRLAQWGRKITQALGGSAQLIVDLAPELALIIGPQPPVQGLSPAETQIRFQLLFLSFVRVFAREEHPLVIFLDDLQWSDVPTLNLVSRLATSPEMNHLLIIGAYRDNEVDTAHPLSLTLGDIEKRRTIERLPLRPLSLQATVQLIRDTFLCDDRNAAELGRILYEKTGGNPFFTIELMKDLKEREVIRFNPALGGWDWDLSQVKGVKYSDNVIDVLVASQSHLRPATQQVLQLAACIGATFDLRTLSIIRGSTPEQTSEEFREALQANMVVPLSGQYKYIGLENPGENGAEPAAAGNLNPTYRFQHDRIQQAAYSLIPPQKRQALHLSIGRLMLSHGTKKEADSMLMSIVDHFNEGRRLMQEPREIHRLARLNLDAGIKAKQSSAYGAALRYLKIGCELLGDTSWRDDYLLAWKLNNELQQCYYLTADWKNADILTDELLRRSRSSIKKGLVLAARTRQYATTGRMQESIHAAFEGLLILGFEFNRDPAPADVAEEARLIKENLAGRAVADLINMPAITDQKANLASQLIMEIFPAAFLSGSGEMFPYLVLKSVNIALRYGSSPEAAFAYAAYGMLLCGLYNDTALGYEYGRLGVDMIEKFDDIALKSRIIYVYTMFVHHWSNHWSSMTPWFRKGIEAGYQSGDLLYLAYSAQDCIIWDPQLDLETASGEHRRLLAIVKECEYQDSFDSGTLFLQMQLNFQGLTQGKFLLSDDTFDESGCVEGMRQRRFMTGISNYHIYKAEIHLLYNDPAGALIHVMEQDKQMLSVIALPQVVRFHIVSFLVRAMLLPDLDSEEQAAFMGRMNESLERISCWARQCPENFEHLRLLMEAELAGFSGAQEALSLYERSIAAARDSAFIRDEAMANELAAQFLLRRGHAKAAEGYLQAAHYLYYRCGAHRKVEDMEAAYPMLGRTAGFKKSKSPVSAHSAGEAAGEDLLDADILDISSVFRASQAISEELELKKLLKATLQILMENAGAQKGFLVEHHDGEIVIQAQSGTSDDAPDSLHDHSGQPGIPVLPVTLINTAIRTREPIVLRDASALNAYSSDPYINAKKPRSVMCVPLPVHGRWPSAVYLENNVTHSAFTDDRVKIIKLLASQASISMENARIYEEQEKLLKAQQRFVPRQFLKHLGHTDIASVELGESIAMEMSVMFSDIRNFTPLVEGLSPQAVIELLNQYYTHLEKPISDCGGFIDSYAGDGLMALFAVPAQQVVKAGIGMSRAINHFNQLHQASGQFVIAAGCGINTGPLVLGTMGANDRMQCSVLGDTVNLASRIEQLTRTYNSALLISESTYRSLEDPGAFSLRKVDRVAVKGKALAVDLYEVLDAERDDRRIAKEATRETLVAGANAYYARRFMEAHSIFMRAASLDPEDLVLHLFISRCKRYMHTPPPDDWHGYERLHQK